MIELTVKTFQVISCCHCPNVILKSTPGAGCATDYYCGATKPEKKIAGYVESSQDGPQIYQFPDFCPLPSLRIEGGLDDFPAHTVVQDPDSPQVVWTKDYNGVWVPSAKRSAGALPALLGKRKPEVLFVPGTRKKGP